MEQSAQLLLEVGVYTFAKPTKCDEPIEVVRVAEGEEDGFEEVDLGGAPSKRKMYFKTLAMLGSPLSGIDSTKRKHLRSSYRGPIGRLSQRPWRTGLLHGFLKRRNRSHSFSTSMRLY